MKSTIILCGYLASLASTAVIDPLLRDKTLQSRSLVPANVVFHDTTTTTTGDGSTNSTGNDGLLPQDPDNISACTGIVYEDTSTDRTEIYRDDCYLLSKKVQASPGFWEMGTWSTVIDQRTYAPLISEGTCQFAVLRLHVNAPGSNNSDVAIIGNQDVFNILNAAVFDFAGQSDEPFMDQMTTEGRMDCMYSYSINASLDFQIQYTDSN